LTIAGMTTDCSYHHRAFTVVEVVACLIVVVLAIVVAITIVPARRGATARRLNDATYVRDIVRGMTTWGGNNGGKFPLPSKVDVENTTVASTGGAKDTTGNILSLLIFNGYVTPQHCVAQRESNTQRVRSMARYSFASPKAAVRPAQALWDPAFRGTPLDPVIPNGPTDLFANQSYASLLPCGARLKNWVATSTTDVPVFANRGPQYAVEDSGPRPQTDRWPLLDGPTGTNSYTLQIYGGRTTWEGIVGYNDCHVSFETRPTPDGVRYACGADSTTLNTPDNLFVNESDEVDGDTKAGEFTKGRNAYLRPVAQYDASGRPTLWRD
jgi:hypothetical protein